MCPFGKQTRLKGSQYMMRHSPQSCHHAFLFPVTMSDAHVHDWPQVLTVSSGNRLFVAGEQILAQNVDICIQCMQRFLMADRARIAAITLVWRKLASRPRACRCVSLRAVRCCR